MIAKIISIGNSSGIVIPAQLLTSLHLKKDDRVVISETPNGFEVQRTEKPKSFEAILEDFYGKPFDEALQEFSAEKDDVTIGLGIPGWRGGLLMKAFSQGDIIWMDFNPQAGHEQAGRRPALVVSRSKFNATGALTMVCPITNTMSRRALRPELPSRSQTKGCILCDHARFVDLAARNAEFREVAPKEIVQASLAILQALLSPDE